MTLPSTIAVPTTSPGPAALALAFQAAVRRLSWRVVGSTFGIVVALNMWLFLDLAAESAPKLPTWEGYLSGTIINVFMAFCIMLTTLVADELVARGAKRFPTYAWAVVIGSAVAAFAQWEAHAWLHLHTKNDVAGIPHDVTIMQPAAVFFEYLIWGSIIVFIYVNRRTALRAAARMNAAQVQRADAQRRTLESRLQALQARIEPQFLFNTLAQVHELYDRDPVRGGEVLGDLIVYLRAALPHLRDSMTTLEQELKLASAYLSIVRNRLGGRLTFQVDVPKAEAAARVPPMILLPLLDQALAKEPSAPSARISIRVAARITDGRLCVEITESGCGFAGEDRDGNLRAIQERLNALYGESGELAFRTATDHGTQAVMEIPHESADGGHR